MFWNFSWLLKILSVHKISVIRNSIVLTVRWMLSFFQEIYLALRRDLAERLWRHFRQNFEEIQQINSKHVSEVVSLVDVSLNLCRCGACFWWSLVVVVSSWLGKPMCKVSPHISYALAADLYVGYLICVMHITLVRNWCEECYSAKVGGKMIFKIYFDHKNFSVSNIQ